jgi:hypothetical protein
MKIDERVERPPYGSQSRMAEFYLDWLAPLQIGHLFPPLPRAPERRFVGFVPAQMVDWLTGNSSCPAAWTSSAGALVISTGIWPVDLFLTNG